MEKKGKIIKKSKKNRIRKKQGNQKKTKKGVSGLGSESGKASHDTFCHPPPFTVSQCDLVKIVESRVRKGGRRQGGPRHKLS